MRHCYTKIVAYNPTDNLVVALHKLEEPDLFNSKASDEAFYGVYLSVDRVENIVIGISIGGDMYQLSPAAYGTYVKEDERSLRFINRSRFLVAVSDYMKKNNIPFDN